MPVFHYALREGGFLILGGAESVVNLERQFQAVSPKWRVYRRIGASRSDRVPPPFPLEPPGKSRARPPVGLHPPARSLTEITQQLTLDRLGPAAALVDRQYRVLVLCGPTDRFLRVPSGEMDAELAEHGPRGAAGEGPLGAAPGGQRRRAKSCRPAA